MRFNNKPPEYYDKVRIKLTDMFPVVKGRYLDVGCGSGATLEYLKTKGASYVAGIDVNEKMLDKALQKSLDFFLVVDVEKDNLPFKEREFDGIVFADILEHLYNPWDTLKKMTKYLKDDGYILLSVPNIKNYSILRKLILNDEWSYSEMGILDDSHIRFFTLKEIKSLLSYAGLKMMNLSYNESSRGIFKYINKLLFNKLFTFTVSQYFIIASKK